MADVRLRAAVPEVIPMIAGWYRAEWAEWFADMTVEEIETDFRNLANRDKLPLGLIAFDSSGEAMGICSLRDDPFEPYFHVGPWLPGLYVHGPWIGIRLAGELICAAEMHAARLGIYRLHAATATAVGRFERAGWLWFDEVLHDQKKLIIFAKRVA